jgi:hypothetical protein
MDFEVWKLVRVYDALSGDCRPKPGDGVLLAQLTTQHLDDSLSRYAGRFLAKSLRDVAFVVGDFKHYLTSDARPSDAPKSSYVTLVLDPLLTVDKFTYWRDLSVEKILTIAAFSSALGDNVPRKLLPLLLPFAESTSYVINFLDEAFKSPHWTEPGLLLELGTQIIKSAIRNMCFNDWKVHCSSANEIDTSQLKTLIKCLQGRHGVSRLGLESQYQMVLDRMVDAELLDPDAFKNMISKRQHTVLVKRRMAKWDVLVSPVHCSVLWKWGA